MRQVPEQYLRSSLLDLNLRLNAKGISLILGGGFGLFLKQLDLLMKENTRTLLPIEAWPKPRTTNDLDLFVPMELLVQLTDMQAVRTILDELKFEAVSGSQFWQFVLPATDVKIDLLTGPIPEEANPLLKFESGENNRRVRPKGALTLHARRTPEALGLVENQEEITVKGKLSNESEYSGTIRIPSPFTYLMMKLTAFGDQVDNEQRVFGRHHALDVYRIIAMMTEDKFTQTKDQFDRYSNESAARTAAALAKDLFGTRESPGIVRMREHGFVLRRLALRRQWFVGFSCHLLNPIVYVRKIFRHAHQFFSMNVLYKLQGCPICCVVNARDSRQLFPIFRN